jgi:hypothetical protein
VGGGFGRGAAGRGGFIPPSGGRFAPGAGGGGFAPPGAGGSTRGFVPQTGGNLTSPRSGGGFAGGFGGDSASLTAAVRYANQHGGGVIGVSSQSSAAAAILSSDANVAGLGGFSGRESSVSATWIAQEVAAGRLRWVIVDNAQGGSLPGDTRTGSQAAMDVIAKTCKKISLTSSGSTVTMYDCQGRAAAILQAAKG